jgi:hypothetical protein
MSVQELLKNYDLKARELMLKINHDFNRYRLDFNTYPDVLEEKKKFMQKLQLEKSLNGNQTFNETVLQLKERFNEYWPSRLQILRDMKIEKEIEIMRQSWEGFADNVYHVSEAVASTLKREGEAEEHHLEKHQKLEMHVKAIDELKSVDSFFFRVRYKFQCSFHFRQTASKECQTEELNEQRTLEPASHHEQGKITTTPCSSIPNAEAQNYRFEVDRDMKYLLAWMHRLTQTERKSLLTLQKFQNTRLFEALDVYFSLVQNMTLSSDSESSSKSETNEPSQPNPEPAVKRILVTRRKSFK